MNTKKNSHNELLNTLVSATFKIQTLADAQAATTFLANQCPNPRLASVGISEMLLNAIEHGNLNINYRYKTQLHETTEWLKEIEHRLASPKYRNKFVTVVFNKTKANINIRITDEGQGFDWHKYEKLDNNRLFDSHGRGIALARSISFERLIYHGNGNDVECIIAL